MHAATIRDEDHLEDLLSEPSPGAVEAMGRLDGDLVILGVGGKMGPTLARMARRASDQGGKKRRIVGVARFSQAGLEAKLQAQGIETIRCDLLDRGQVEKLPEAPNVVAMSGMKFGTTGQQALTWAMNCYVPAVICERYRRSRVVAFSTGNLYGMAPVRLMGSIETDELAPVGEYPQSTLGRERMYEYFSRTYQMPMVLLRLNYATEMRYGVLVDVARKVFKGDAIDVTMGHLNAIWQGDANAMSLCAFDHLATPACVLNLSGPEVLSVRRIAEEFGRLLERPVRIEGHEAEDAFLTNAQLSHRLFGYPRAGAQQMIHWIADWVKQGRANLGKPTHFEVRSGKY